MPREFVTTSIGLHRQMPPMRLFELSKRLGVWNPSEIELVHDRLDWLGLARVEQTVLLHLTSLFQAGEEAVTRDLLPLIQVISDENRLEEELYLTSFLFEEAKHTDFFRRFLDEVAEENSSLAHFHGEHYRTIFYHTLPEALARLRIDPSPSAQIEASVTYNLIVEGMLAETGYHAYLSILERNDLLPGMRKGIHLLKQDESRHIAYGIYFLSRLLAEDGSLWQVVDDRMNQLLPAALGVIGDLFAAYDPMPFGLVEDDFTSFALGQFNKRYERLEKARGASLESIYRMTTRAIDENDA